MSDMSRPGVPPTMPDHEQHDALLVAQLAAGDALEPDQHQQASWLVANCGACAELAADLRAVSRAVAWEPVPPRRRDLRVSPDQAERARGSFLDRFVRRLAMPQSNALRPAAAGVMSLGLLFMVAGAAWPFDESTDTLVVPTAAPRAVELRDRAPAPEVGETRDDGFGGVSGASGAMSEASAVPLEQGEMAASQKALLTEDTAADQLRAQDDAPAAEAEEFAADALEQFAVEAGVEEPDAATRREAPDAAAEIASSPAPVDGEAALPNASVGADFRVTAPIASSSTAGITTETLLLALGVVLALGGALVLLLMWLARRAGDPLLR